MKLEVFVNSNPEIASLPLGEFDQFIKGLENHKEMAMRTNKLDWHSELIASIRHCETIKSCLNVFHLKKDIEDKKPAAGQFAIAIAEIEAQLKLRGIDTEASYKKWKENGKFSL